MLAIPVAQHGHAALVHLLDAFGADLEEVDDVRGGPPLMHAANNGHSAAVNALVAVRWARLSRVGMGPMRVRLPEEAKRVDKNLGGQGPAQSRTQFTTLHFLTTTSDVYKPITQHALVS